MAFEPSGGYGSAVARETETSIQWPLIKILRPKQWVKNLLVLAPLVFAGLFTDPIAIREAALATGLFCVASAATYVYNDLNDIEEDRAHPVKRHTRPLAAGDLQPATAKLELAVLLTFFAAGAFFEPWVALAVGGYLAVNLAYNQGLKDVPVLDLFAVATGFVLRVFAGAIAIGVAVSPWMLVTTLCLALYLATQKRLSEQAENGDEARAVLGDYPRQLLERYSHLAAIGAIVFYSLYTMEVRQALSVTIPFVLLGFFRFSYLAETGEGGEDPISLAFHDRVLVATVACWGLVSLALLWPGSGIPV